MVRHLCFVTTTSGTFLGTLPELQVWQLFARIYGTNNVNNCSYYCHQASGVGLNQALGTGTATIAVLRFVERLTTSSPTTVCPARARGK